MIGLKFNIGISIHGSLPKTLETYFIIMPLTSPMNTPHEMLPCFCFVVY